MRRKIVKRNTAIRKSAKSKRSSSRKLQWGSYFFVLFCTFSILVFAYHYRSGLAYYLGFKSTKVFRKQEEKRMTDVRNFQLLSKYSDRVVGIDVSEYQGDIAWHKVKTIEYTFPIRFVLMRATAGKDKVDAKYHSNWENARRYDFVRGAYHYYRPNENSLQQADFFIKTVRLKKGDLPPILDIESMPKNQSIDSLKVGLRRWLTQVEQHYKIRPIIYTNEKFYEDFLRAEFSDFRFWIANYNFFVETMQEDWQFWQFTEKASIEGIKGNVDVNIFNGTPKMLVYLTKQ